MEGVSDDDHDIRPMCLRGQRKVPIVQPGFVHVRDCEHADTTDFSLFTSIFRQRIVHKSARSLHCHCVFSKAPGQPPTRIGKNFRRRNAAGIV
jgi:hypothetical protein